MSKKSVLIIAPHPDDEVLGCGGLIRKYAGQNMDVYVLVMSRGTPKLYSPDRIENVRNEARQAHEILGVKETIFLNFYAPEMDDVPLADISTAIAEVIKKQKTEMLFIPHRGDIHNDHTVVFKAALVAARPVGNYTVKEIYSYETLSETEWAPPFGDDAFIPTYFVDITNEFPAKLEAMRYFKSQLKEFPNPRSLETIEALAKFRGATVGFDRAEAFMTIRRISE
jgi:LmbE family N-acetylglucosaminyl deacetylase